MRWQPVHDSREVGQSQRSATGQHTEGRKPFGDSVQFEFTIETQQQTSPHVPVLLVPLIRHWAAIRRVAISAPSGGQAVDVVPGIDLYFCFLRA